VARAKPVMATRVYAAELDDVSARVADLIAANAGGQG
jgi:membrane fusion protein (multidrug efflux system)